MFEDGGVIRMFFWFRTGLFNLIMRLSGCNFWRESFSMSIRPKKRSIFDLVSFNFLGKFLKWIPNSEELKKLTWSLHPPPLLHSDDQRDDF